jgi:hypothetical protein
VDVVNLATLGAASLAVRLFTEAGALVRGAAALKAAEEAAATTARATEEAAAIAAQKAAATATRNLDDLASLRGASVDDVRRLIPKGWIETPLKKGEGTRFLNPDRQGESIMIEKGWPGAKDPLHGGPYVRISRNGVVKRIPLDGNTVLGP